MDLAVLYGAVLCVRDAGRIFVLIALLLSLPACSDLPSLGEQPTRPIDMFEAVVFGQEYGTGRSEHLAKWSGPLIISLEGKDASHYKPTVARHASTLSTLTGLKIAFAKPKQKTNVAIVFSSLDELETLAGSRIPYDAFRKDILLTSGCIFFYKRDAKHRITEATIFVRTGEGVRNDVIESCLLEEMTQILGLPNDSDLITPSIFNRRDGLIKLTALDEAFVRTLYNPSMTVGMPRQQALSKARLLLEPQ